MKRQQISFGAQIRVVLTTSGLVAVIEVINLVTGRELNRFGLIPRDIDAFYGVLTAPLLHGSSTHFLSNIVPLAIFSLLLLQHGVRRFWLVTAGCILLSGALVWLFGRGSIHVGASGLIYGYFGYLVVAGLLSGEIKLMLISIVVGIGYGGLIFGVLPSDPNISWESHLFGFIAGIVCAFLWGKDTSAAA